MSFSLQTFIDNPCFEKLSACRKDDLICLAAHYDIPIVKSALKKDIKKVLVEGLVELEVIVSPMESVLSGSTDGAAGSDHETSSTPGEPEESAPPTTPEREKKVFSPKPAGSDSGSDLQVRLARLQLEAQERERQAEVGLRLQIRKLEIEADKEVRLRQIELEMQAKTAESSAFTQRRNSGDFAVTTKAAFDVGKNIALVPLFREAEVDSYFNAFERIATALQWPREMWAILLQCKLLGKAQEVVASMSLEDSMKYDTVKEAVLRVYELVPEAYRQRFRNHKRSGGQTFVEFAREKCVLFDKWCASSKVGSDYESLRQLVLLEDFKNTLPERIVVFLNEQKATSLSAAAVLADEFSLTHKPVFVPAGTDRPAVLRQKAFELPRVAVRKGTLSQSPPRDIRECFYCHKKGHVIASCPSLTRKDSSGPTPTLPKGVALVKTVPEKTASHSASLARIQKKEPDSCFAPFITKGSVAYVTGHIEWRPVTILRDTGCSQSLIREGVLPELLHQISESRVIVQGVGMRYLNSPLHKIQIDSPMVKGACQFAVLPALPVPGIDLILGNDLAGGLVIPVPELTGEPGVQSPVDDVTCQFPGIFPACAVTRSQAKSKEVDLSDTFFGVESFGESGRQQIDSPTQTMKPSPRVVPELPATREDFVKAQKSDASLANYFLAASSNKETEKSQATYLLEDELLLRRWSKKMGEEWSAVYQVVVPAVFRPLVLSLAHDDLWSGHMGINKTYHRVLQHYFWPGLKRDVVQYCRTCHTCQVVGKPNQTISPAPLKPIPAVGEPFDHIIIDCVGPLPRTKSGYQFLLTLMCSSTRFPEAIPLRTINATAVTKAFVKFFTTFGLPRTVQTDQGTNFKSKVFQMALKTLGVSHITSTPYHPESQGALERFHQSMKSMLRKHCFQSTRNWDESIPFILFAAREAVQESLGFSPAELVFGHKVRGPLKMFKETLCAPTTAPTNLSDYVTSMRRRLQDACLLAKEKLIDTQIKMKQTFDRKAAVPLFQPGDYVLALLPEPHSALSPKFSGPYQVLRKVSDTNYVIKTPERRRSSRMCHANMLKPYHSRSEVSTSISPVLLIDATSSSHDDELTLAHASQCGARLDNSAILATLPDRLYHLPLSQCQDLVKLINEFQCLFGDIPSQTTVLQHDIVLAKSNPIKQNAYRVNPEKREVMKKEVEYLVQHGFAVPSFSPWSSPCVLDSKPDGNPRFCTDFRKVNAVTVKDAHPLPLIDDCIDDVGPATFVTKLDMLKGYWQVPLTARASEISAFVTPDSFLQYTVMPFGLCNAPATFQRLINKVLGGVPKCRAYLDDIVVYSTEWSEHLATLRIVFQRLANASLTLNLAKCEFGKATVRYLGQLVGSGKVCPVDVKVKAISEFPPPSTRKELRRFLGLVGYYRRYCKNFSSVVAPLTNLTSPSVQYVWTSECQTAFDNVKGLLCCSPVLSVPVFGKPFKLEIDASDVGTGAVLLQADDEGIDHPVCYHSRKFNVHQRRYSTVEKETLALLFALQHFDAYLGSSAEPIQVYTDHNPLVFLSRMYNSNQRLMRWSLIIQEYHLDIRHKKGAENVLADALSRAM